MWRLVNNTRPPIPPADMINTQVSIHINFKQTLKDNPILDHSEPEIRTHVRRCGVFETFNDEGLVLGTTAEVQGEKFQIRQYSGTIVPAFKMMSYETAYRVFENKTVIEIIDEVTDGFPNLKLDKSRLGSASVSEDGVLCSIQQVDIQFPVQADGAVRHLVFLRS